MAWADTDVQDIMFLAHRMPFPPNRGDKIRSHHLLKGLARIGKVHVGTFAENADDMAQEKVLEGIAKSYILENRHKPLPLAGLEAIVRRKPVSLTAFDNSTLRRWVTDTIAEHAIETIFIFSGQMGQYVPPDFDGRIIVDLCDVDSAKFEAYAEDGQRAWLNRREAKLLSVEERRLARCADTTLLISREEADLFRRRSGLGDSDGVKVLANGVDAEHFHPSSTAPHPALEPAIAHFVFTGQMDYAPNIDAVVRFAKFIFPEVRNRIDAEFHIVGRAPSEAVVALDGLEGVSVWGEVPDMRPFLRGATAVVAPLEIARGVQNKVLEAMAMARPVLLTPEAATGIDAENGKHFLIRETDNDFADTAVDLASQRGLGDSIGTAARSFVLECMSWESVYAELAEIVDTGQGSPHAN